MASDADYDCYRSDECVMDQRCPNWGTCVLAPNLTHEELEDERDRLARELFEAQETVARLRAAGDDMADLINSDPELTCEEGRDARARWREVAGDGDAG